MDWPSWAEMGAPLTTRMPKVDVIDRDKEVFIRAEVPGVEKEGLEVTVSDNAVTIKGETKHEEKEEKSDYYRSEISHGTFSRTIALPDIEDTRSAPPRRARASAPLRWSNPSRSATTVAQSVSAARAGRCTRRETTRGKVRARG
jgi:hypothetical protein